MILKRQWRDTDRLINKVIIASLRLVFTSKASHDALRLNKRTVSTEPRQDGLGTTVQTLPNNSGNLLGGKSRKDWNFRGM